ncbi:hypothetical protein PR048_016347 [Dryococelus australis]|uniref:Pol-like protein n=1 Tax=Dryococelus australis TaxID=614101 RepID=A0ABQ9HJH2_9NEOP|nr:hypothetical protein PR048_016347 [Dryococelus australis]
MITFNKPIHIKAKQIDALTLWNMLREKFWILKGRQLTHSISFDFVVPPPLLPSKVNDVSVFEVCGIDYAGPLIMKEYRALYLENVTSGSTDFFLLALWRLIACRGRPSVIYSDKATSCWRSSVDWIR